MPAVEKEVADKAGRRPKIGVGVGSPVPAGVIVQSQQHCDKRYIEGGDGCQEGAAGLGQQAHAKQKIKCVVVDDVGGKYQGVAQPQCQQENCAFDGGGDGVVEVFGGGES